MKIESDNIEKADGNFWVKRRYASEKILGLSVGSQWLFVEVCYTSSHVIQIHIYTLISLSDFYTQ